MKWDGDGRKKVAPPKGALGEPIAVRSWQAKRIIEAFEHSGHSTHSGQGSTLWVILDYCNENGIPYDLTAKPGEGYFVERRVTEH